MVDGPSKELQRPFGRLAGSKASKNPHANNNHLGTPISADPPSDVRQAHGHERDGGLRAPHPRTSLFDISSGPPLGWAGCPFSVHSIPKRPTFKSSVTTFLAVVFSMVWIAGPKTSTDSTIAVLDNVRALHP